MLRSADGVVVDAAALSDPGRDPEKQTNEDAVAISEIPNGVAAVVCDGMGGHDAGEVASRTAVQRILETLRSGTPGLDRVLSRSLELAHADVYALGGDAPLEVRPGSTAVVVVISGAEALIAHVGDSRAYRVRSRAGQPGQSLAAAPAIVERLTRDHSVVEALLAARAITDEIARNHPDANRITRALGIAADVEPEVRAPLRAQIGEHYVLCSDGLSDLVDDAEIGELVSTAASPEAACEALVGLANNRGGHDNVTVAVLRVLSLGTRVSPPASGPRDPPTVLDAPPATLLMQTTKTAPQAVHPTHPGGSDDGRLTTPTLIDPLILAASGVQPAKATKLDPRAHPPLGRASAPPEQGKTNWLFWGGLGACVLILFAILLWSALR